LANSLEDTHGCLLLTLHNKMCPSLLLIFYVFAALMYDIINCLILIIFPIYHLEMHTFLLLCLNPPPLGRFRSAESTPFLFFHAIK